MIGNASSLILILKVSVDNLWSVYHKARKLFVTGLPVLVSMRYDAITVFFSS